MAVQVVKSFTSSYVFGNVKLIIFQCFVVFVSNCKIALTQDVTLSPLCGSSLYDIETLKSAPYWTITRPGICYHSYNSTEQCVINLAFCKDLPLDKSRGKYGIGASQETPNLVGSEAVILGLESSFSDDNSGDQLIVGYSDGDEVDCGPLSVLLFLRCNKDASWSVPLDGKPGEIPSSPAVNLDDCLYIIIADYAGACAVQSTSLSAGTILIIIFFVFVAVYLVGGLIYNKVGGASGWELIPNYDTWNRLPSDIMIGCGFFFSCITCQGGGGGDGLSSKTYESI